MRLGRTLLVLMLATGAAVFVWRESLPPSNPDAGTSQEAGSRPSRRGGGGGGRRGGGGGDGPVPVLTAASRIEDVPVTLDAVGTALALNTVTVRSQVDGRLMELAFREGQDVKRGDVIARIDPTIYQAQYDQAVAKKAQDEANLANARIDFQRYQSLASTNAGSRQQADTQRALVAQLEAQVRSDQGAIDKARAYLDYATIRSPLDGRLGIRLVDQGNLIRAGDTTGLVVITQLKPIAIVFNLPQQNLRAVTGSAMPGGVPVEALEADNRTVIDRGRLEVVDNQVDQQTGTVKIKAVFPNADLQLWPGAFVNVRLTVDTLRRATVVPTAAVQRGPNGAFVYGVQDDKAVQKPVTIVRQTEQITVLGSGVSAPERVVTTGFARLTEGERVSVSGEAPVEAGTTAQPEPRRRPAEAGTESGRPPGEGRRRQRDSAAPTDAARPPGEAQPSGDTRPRGEARPPGEVRSVGPDRPGRTGSTPP